LRRRRIVGGDDYVFVSLDSTPLSYGGFRKAWLVVRRHADLPPPRASGRGPRVHDIRHTFAVRALESAPNRRDRIARHMLAVSTYLGHSCVADTYWYFQATPTLLSQVADACQRHFEGAQP
jgi:integrase